MCCAPRVRDASFDRLLSLLPSRVHPPPYPYIRPVVLLAMDTEKKLQTARENKTKADEAFKQGDVKNGVCHPRSFICIRTQIMSSTSVLSYGENY